MGGLPRLIHLAVMAVRDALITVHRWIGLAVGLFFAIASLTGAVVVYQPELEALVNLGAYDVTEGDVGLAAVLAAVAREAPDGRVASVSWPSRRMPAYQVQVSGPNARPVWVDPGSGRVIRPAWRPPLIQAIRALHTSLLAGRWGSRVVTWTSVIALFVMVTGLFLWWPGIRRFLHGFRIRLRRDLYVLSYDTHQVVGALALPMLFLMTFTGVLLPFPTLARTTAHALWGERAPPRPPPRQIRLEPPVPIIDRSSPEELFEAARARVDGAEPAALVLPGNEHAPARVVFGLGPQRASREVVAVLVHPATAEILDIDDPRALAPPERLFQTGWVGWHTGRIGGEVARVIYVVSCLAGGFLVPTGVIVWWLKRRRIQAAAGRRADRGTTAL